jgi:hypothetical protein
LTEPVPRKESRANQPGFVVFWGVSSSGIEAPAAEQFAETVALQSEGAASAAKAGLILWHLRGGLKPRISKQNQN